MIEIIPVKKENMPQPLKQILWQFVRMDSSLQEFEQWIYSNAELESFITKESYIKLIEINFKDMHLLQAEYLRLAIFKLLIQFQENCLCSAIPSFSIFCPFFGDQEVFNIKCIYKQINLLKTKMVLDKYHNRTFMLPDHFYYPAKICYCTHCHQKWFLIFDESDLDYYLIRLNLENKKLMEYLNKNNLLPHVKKENFLSLNKIYFEFPNFNIDFINQEI